MYCKRLNAKKVIFPEENGKIIFPVADGRINLSGRDQELRTPTLIREHPVRGEGHADFLGESEGSLPPPQDSHPDAGEVRNDFWSISGNFLYRHHVEPRVKLYSPREESFPIPLKYIDVSRTTHTNLVVMQEKRIDDYWNTDGSRDLSLRMLARNWKRRWLLLCLARQARDVSMARPVSKPMSSNQNLRVFWKPVNPQDCVWKNLYRIIMRTILQERGTIHCNIIIWYTNLFLCLKP